MIEDRRSRESVETAIANSFPWIKGLKRRLGAAKLYPNDLLLWADNELRKATDLDRDYIKRRVAKRLGLGILTEKPEPKGPESIGFKICVCGNHPRIAKDGMLYCHLCQTLVCQRCYLQVDADLEDQVCPHCLKPLKKGA